MVWLIDCINSFLSFNFNLHISQLYVTFSCSGLLDIFTQWRRESRNVKLWARHLICRRWSYSLPIQMLWWLQSFCHLKKKLTVKCFAGHLQPKQSYPSLTNHLLRYPAPEFKVCAWGMQSNVEAAAAAVGEISKYAKEWNIFEHIQSILQGIFFTGFAPSRSWQNV